MKHSHIILAGALMLAVVMAVMILHTFDDIDLAKEEPPFSSIVLPLKSIRGTILLDGGSVWVRVEDSKESSYDFFFPYDHKSKGYPNAFHGADPYAPESVRLTNPSRARHIVLGWLSQSDRHDEGLEAAYDYLSGQNNSIISRLKHDGLIGIFK